MTVLTVDIAAGCSSLSYRRDCGKDLRRTLCIASLANPLIRQPDAAFSSDARIHVLFFQEK